MKSITLFLLLFCLSIHAQSENEQILVRLKGRVINLENNKPIKRKIVKASRNQINVSAFRQDFGWWREETKKTDRKGEFEMFVQIEKNDPELWLGINDYSQINFINLKLGNDEDHLEIDLGDIYLVPFTAKQQSSVSKTKRRSELTLAEIDAKLLKSEKYGMTRNELEEFSTSMTLCNLSRRKSCNYAFNTYHVLSFTKDLSKIKPPLETIEIRGTVLGDSIPLSAANISIKNSKKGTITNREGQFKLEAVKGDILSISYVGYEAKEIQVEEDATLKVHLKNAGQLQGMEITGYLSSSKISCAFRCFGTTKVIEPTRIIEQKDLEDEMVKLFPNPSSSGIFNLKLYEHYDNITISVANISGQIIKNMKFQNSGEKLSVDLSQYSQGIYIINIIADGVHLSPVKAVRS